MKTYKFKDFGRCLVCIKNPCECERGEMKTIQEWAHYEGYHIQDPDGFDRTDPLLWERKITKEAFDKGFLLCTIMKYTPVRKGGFLR